MSNIVQSTKTYVDSLAPNAAISVPLPAAIPAAPARNLKASVVDSRGNDLSAYFDVAFGASTIQLTSRLGYTLLERGLTVSYEWADFPAFSRLVLNGTGTVTVDVRNADGSIDLAAYTATVSGAVDDVHYPYPGEHAVQIRAALTGTLQAEVL